MTTLRERLGPSGFSKRPARTMKRRHGARAAPRWRQRRLVALGVGDVDACDPITFGHAVSFEVARVKRWYDRPRAGRVLRDGTRRAGRAAALALCLAAVAPAPDEVPFITTPDEVTLAMLELAAVGPAITSSTSARATAASSSPPRAASAPAASASRSCPTWCRTSRERRAPPAWPGRVEFREQDLFADRPRPRDAS